MIKFFDSNIVNILPESLSKKEYVIALGYALNKAVQRFMVYCENISVYAVIDGLSHEALDLLAMEMDTQYYDDSLDIAEKRKLVKSTFIWYMSAGTPKAVEELVSFIFGEGEVQEWFEYGDNPYYFKIITESLMKPEINDELIRMLKKIKNARSHLRAVEYYRNVSQTVYASQGILNCYHPAPIIDGYNEKRAMTQNAIAGTGMYPVVYTDSVREVLELTVQTEQYSYGGIPYTGYQKAPAVMT